MKQYQRKIKEYKSLIQKEYIQETAVCTVMERCSDIVSRQDNRRASYFEFLFEQFKFIKKRWWALQGGILFLLWILLADSDGGANTERTLGAMSVMFSVMIVPEIWKNRRFSAVEIEKTAFYSLRQICAARTLLFAAGDAVQVKHYVTGDDALISLAGPANKQGRIIADNICGGDSRYLGSQGSSVIKVFDITAATTGINETNAKKSGLEVDTVILSPMSHAGYYPGGKVMTMKVVFEKDTYRLLGAQIIGYEGVDKRIDVLATAIHAGLKATQLKDLDLAYAPPYSSAKDPVNMAGFMIDNIAKGTLKQWHLEDMDKISKDKSVVLLDVRTVGEFNRGHMDGFKNIPVDELRERINEIEKGKPVYLICQSGLRSYIASRILEGNGYETYNFSGGFRFYDVVVNDRVLIERSYVCGMDY